MTSYSLISLVRNKIGEDSINRIHYIYRIDINNRLTTEATNARF